MVLVGMAQMSDRLGPGLTSGVIGTEDRGSWPEQDLDMDWMRPINMQLTLRTGAGSLSMLGDKQPLLLTDSYKS